MFRSTLYTKILLHQTTLTQETRYSENLYTRGLPQEDAITQETLCTKELLRQTVFTPEDFLRRKMFTPRTFRTFKPENFEHEERFTPKNFYTRRPLHQNLFTPNPHSYTSEIRYKRKTNQTMKYLHQELCCTRGNLNPIAEETSCTKKLCLQTTFRQSVLHQNPFPPQDSYTTSFYTRQLLHQRALHQIIRYCLHRKPLGLTPKTFSHEELCWPRETKFPRFLRHCFTFLRSLSVISFVRSTRRYMTEMTCQVRHVNIVRVFPNNNSVCAMRFMRDFGRCTEPAPWSFAGGLRRPTRRHLRCLRPVSPPAFTGWSKENPKSGWRHFSKTNPIEVFWCTHFIAYTRNHSQQATFTPEGLYTRNLTHQRTFTPNLLKTKGAFHQRALTPAGFFTPKGFLKQKVSTPGYFYNRRLFYSTSHQRSFIPEHLRGSPAYV